MRETSAQMRVSMSLLNQVDDRDRELRLWLLSAATHHGVTYYRIAGRFTSNGQTWEVSHRYSEFLTLRDKLVKFLSSSTDKCPGCRNYLHAIQRFDFPKKHMFVSRTPIVVNYRVKALRSFLNLLASWAFSKTPKCPTCGGYAFNVVRNFVVEGDDPSTDVDMNSIRESVVVEAFAGPNSSRGSTYTRRHSWIPASGAMALEIDTVQSMHVPPPSRQQARPTDESSFSGVQQSRASHAQQPRPSTQHPRPSGVQSSRVEQPRPSAQHPRPSGVQSSRGEQPRPSAPPARPSGVQSSRGAQPRSSAPPARPSGVQSSRGAQEHHMHHQRSRPDDDPYDAFNDYLPERPSRMKKVGQSNMEAAAKVGKFSSRTLEQELQEKRRRERESHENDTVNSQQRLMRKHRSEPHNLSARRPLAESDLSVGTSNFESPRSSKKASQATGESASTRHFDSFFSDASMATEPIFVHADEQRRYGLSDDEKKADSSSVYSSDDEIDTTGVALASPPRSRRKASGEGLWQPWELARVA
ncbi:hypothetical protein BBJ28_00004567 [Nothophytophthora sp. Chile5]|nr:hypothetical protein BBJ28_00004567 [Nothophytophthora sp. Chile5]